MVSLNLSCYEGSYNFIFVSYKRDESDIVYPIVERLAEEGYRIWIDRAENAIAGGEKWHDVLMQHIDACRVFICFLSDLSVNHSPFCRDERLRAVEKRKVILPIYIDDVIDLPEDESSLSGIHGLFLSEYQQGGKEQLIRRIISSKGMDECKKPTPTGANQKLFWQDGSRYEGDLKDGVMHGHGRLTWAIGSVYEGEFENGRRKHGRMTWSGNTYEGDWDGNPRSGYGIMHYADGSEYVGMWKSDKRTGRGKFVANGPKYMGLETYEGEWENDKQNGIGTSTYHDGRIHVGEYRNGVADGYGTTSFNQASSDLKTYTGMYRDGAFSGNGVGVFRNDCIYEGSWKDNLPDGFGIKTWPDGKVFEGMWRRGHPVGRGTFIPPQGPIIEKIWNGNDGEVG